MTLRTPVNYSQGNKEKIQIIDRLVAYTKKLEQSILYLKWKFHLIKGKAEKVNLAKIPKGALPILINNFNRLNSLQIQIEWLLSISDNIAIIIIDNNSAYRPLLDFYKQLNVANIQVVSLNFNTGIWGLPYILKQLKFCPKYIVTDPDLIPYQNTPKDTLQHLSSLLDKYPAYNHIGLSIEVKDIPVTYPMQKTVQKWEEQFWCPKAKTLNNEVCIANVDTTFAMYRQDSDVFAFNNSLRTLRPYTLKHVDWYFNPKKPCPEYQFYLNHCRPIASWAEEWKRKTGKTAFFREAPAK